jgi:hypothetical protein
MRWSAATLGRAACGAAVLGACAIAGMIVAWPTGDAFDTRFPDVKDIAAPPEQVRAAQENAAQESVAQDSAAQESDELQRALFSPYLTSPPTAVQPAGPMLAMPVQQPAAPAPAVASKPAVASGRGSSRTVTVLNDAQIVSIKRRLNLTPDQEQMWPAVEVALRKLAYAKHDRGPRKPGAKDGGAQDAAARLAMLDPASDDVEHLKSAAVPLIMSFREDQERELRILAQIAGLEKLIPGKNADRP